MINVYLSKSNNSPTILVDGVRYLLDKCSNVRVLEWTGVGPYNSDDIRKSDYMVMVLPRNFCDEPLIGRGQYLQIKEFVNTKSIDNIYCTFIDSDFVGKLNSMPCVTGGSDWNNYARLDLSKSVFNLTQEMTKQTNKPKTTKSSKNYIIKIDNLEQLREVYKLLVQQGISGDCDMETPVLQPSMMHIENNYINSFGEVEDYDLKEFDGVPFICYKDFIKLHLNNNSKNNNSMKNSTTSALKTRLMSQFMPVLAEDLGISMDGNICIFKGDDAISINTNGELTNYPSEMAMKCGLYLINKPVKDVNVGDIVKINGSYGKVLKLGKTPNDIKVLTFTGTKSTKVTAKDGLFNTNNVQVVLNVFGDSIQGMNPMLMMLMMDKEGENDSMSSMLPFLMMSQQQGCQQNMFGGMNPMMLMMLTGKGDIDPMMLMMMSGGFGNMMPTANIVSEK